MEQKNPSIGEVRGKGLMVGVELIKDSRKTPAVKEAAEVKKTLRRRGFLIGIGGLHGNVLRLEPPLVITQEEIDGAMDVIESALRAA